jgi:D-alanine-D-alanine ligase
MIPKLKIAVLVDQETIVENDPQLELGRGKAAEEVEFHVAETLREMGHETVIIPFCDNFHDTVESLRRCNPGLVFNLTEHHRGDRRKDQHIASLLELMELRYTGTDPTGLMLCRDKAMCKRILSHHRIKVPDFASLPMGKKRIRRKFPFPVIVKPRFEDGSDGISLSSLVSNEEELADRVTLLQERMGQPVICEEYIEGREVYVGVTGNDRLSTYPAREVRFPASHHGPQFATSRVKLDEAYRKKWNIQFTDAELSEEMELKASRISKQIYRLLQLRDYGRIDMRITAESQFVFLEANPNPDLTMGDELAEAAEKSGLSYKRLIARILHHAWNRYKDGGR